MNKLVFVNPGEIDIRAITTIGVSVKSDSAVGFFGSGFKYALSIILRLGGSMVVYQGEKRIQFSSEKEIIRDKEFEIVHMDGKPLGFTTEFGKTWEPWMALREILCNCVDEEGEYYACEDDNLPTPTEGTTTIIIECEELYTAFQNLSSFLLDKTIPIWSNGNIEIYPGATTNLFYKGVKVYTSNKPFIFTYNIKQKVDLTEDRTLNYSHYWIKETIGKGLSECDNKIIVNTLCSIGKDYHEYDIEYPSNIKSEVLVAKVRSTLGKADIKCPPSLQISCKPPLKESLQLVDAIELDVIEQSQLDKAIKFLKEIKIIKQDYPIKVVADLGEGIMGLADIENKLIYIDQMVFDKGTAYVASTLYEEYIHVHYGVEDYTRAFQDVCIEHIVLLGQRLLGDSL